jgi:hypothetical protein
MGGNVPSHEEVLRFVHELARREGLAQQISDRQSSGKQTQNEERMAHV